MLHWENELHGYHDDTPSTENLTLKMWPHIGNVRSACVGIIIYTSLRVHNDVLKILPADPLVTFFYFSGWVSLVI